VSTTATTLERIILVTRETRLEESIVRFNTKSQAKFFIEKRGQSFDDYQLEYDNYQKSKDLVASSLPTDMQVQFIDRSFLANFIFTDSDLVVTIGQDGLVVNVAKYLNGQPIVAVNPDPERFDGVILPFVPTDLEGVIERVTSGRFDQKQITMGRVDLNDGQTLYAFNDFFMGASSHISARYTVSVNSSSERHSSSGMILSTPVGYTGWLSSIYNMTRGFSRYAGAAIDIENKPPGWDARELTFVTREPFRSKWSGADLVAGQIHGDESVIVESHMPESGVIFSDGMEADFLEFNSGATATFKVAEKTTNLVY